jgi:hypothetical protein
MPLSSPLNWRTFLVVYAVCTSFLWGAALGATGGTLSWQMFSVYWQPRVVYAADYYAPQTSSAKYVPAPAELPLGVRFQLSASLAD